MPLIIPQIVYVLGTIRRAVRLSGMSSNRTVILLENPTISTTRPPPTTKQLPDSLASSEPNSFNPLYLEIETPPDLNQLGKVLIRARYSSLFMYFDAELIRAA